MSNSWDSYLDNMCAQANHNIEKCCIIGLDGGSVWNSPGHQKALKITPQEGAKIASGFKSKDFTPFMASGIHVEGTKYQFLREEDGKMMLGKKKGVGFVTFQCSKQAVLCCWGSEAKQQGSANKGIGVVADYLESVGY